MSFNRFINGTWHKVDEADVYQMPNAVEVRSPEQRRLPAHKIINRREREARARDLCRDRQIQRNEVEIQREIAATSHCRDCIMRTRNRCLRHDKDIKYADRACEDIILNEWK